MVILIIWHSLTVVNDSEQMRSTEDNYSSPKGRAQYHSLSLHASEYSFRAALGSRLALSSIAMLWLIY